VGRPFCFGGGSVLCAIQRLAFFDKQLLEADIEGSLAYARALERAGVFARKKRISVERGLRRILDENRQNPEIIDRSQAEDVHTYVEEALKKRWELWRSNFIRAEAEMTRFPRICAFI